MAAFELKSSWMIPAELEKTMVIAEKARAVASSAEVRYWNTKSLCEVLRTLRENEENGSSLAESELKSQVLSALTKQTQAIADGDN